MFECFKLWFCGPKAIPQNLIPPLIASHIAVHKELHQKEMEAAFENARRQLEQRAAETVTCDTCKCIIHKKDAQEVKYANPGMAAFLESHLFGTPITTSRVLYYCRQHRKPYDRMASFQYFKEVEVDDKGIPVGFKPVKKSKK